VPLLVHPLSDGPLDLIGDVHGEAEALESLLARLGYDADGRHPHGRRLTFCGDLVDRGHDSPGTVERVAHLVQSGRAQAVLGNHELNLVLDKAKEGNGWYFEDDHDRARGHFLESIRIDPGRRAAMLEWFGTLPLVLERPDLRVVHACWDRQAVDMIRGEARDLPTLDRVHKARVDEELRAGGLLEKRADELAKWGHVLNEPTARVPLLTGVAAVDSARQSKHPLKVITSGIERPTAAPFYASGKWRMTERTAWWNDYDDQPAVVMGHYWRWPGDESEATARSRGPNLFEGSAPTEWLGTRRNVMCIDWCAGLRWRERAAGVTEFSGRLGALRWPEREIVFDR
jgi:hypothetical protein